MNNDFFSLRACFLQGISFGTALFGVFWTPRTEHMLEDSVTLIFVCGIIEGVTIVVVWVLIYCIMYKYMLKRQHLVWRHYEYY